MDGTKRKKQAQLIRVTRKVHRYTGLALALFFFVVGVTGLLLGWKKQAQLLPPTSKGASAQTAQWLPVDSLTKNAHHYLQRSVPQDLSLELDRIDIRPDKGIAKFIYANHYWEVQVDCTNAALLSVGQRHSDFLEHLHDFSLFDRQLKTGEDYIKLFYTTIMGLSVIVFTLTGFWLWYGPKQMKSNK
jgi:uncharacterized iron-regulated membrane protein